MDLLPVGIGPIVPAAGDSSALIGEGLRFAWDNRESIRNGAEACRNWLSNEPGLERPRSRMKRKATSYAGAPAAKCARTTTGTRRVYTRATRKQRRRRRAGNTLKRRYYRKRSYRRKWKNYKKARNNTGVKNTTSSQVVFRARETVDYVLGFGKTEPDIKSLRVFSSSSTPLEWQNIPYPTRSKFQDYYFAKLKNMRVNYSNFRRHDVCQMFGDKQAPGQGGSGTTTTQQMVDHDDIVCHYYFDSKGVFSGSHLDPTGSTYKTEYLTVLGRLKRLSVASHIHPCLITISQFMERHLMDGLNSAIMIDMVTYRPS